MTNLSISEQETWKDIPGLDRYYQISNLLRVRSISKKWNIYGGRIMTFSLFKAGYPYVAISINGRKFKKMVHVLVAKSFIPNPHNKPYVNHLNGNKADYSIQNLEWVTCSENALHAHRTGLTNMSRSIEVHKLAIGAKNSNAKKVAQYNKDGKLIKIWDCHIDAATALGVNRKSISDNVRGRRPSAYGFIWKNV